MVSRAMVKPRVVTRTALVSGGNRGIGYETCRQLAHAGLSVLMGSRDRRKGEGAAARLRKEGLDVTTYSLDVADPASVEDCVKQLATEGRTIDVLINNAAIYPTADALHLDEATFHEAIEINLLGPWRLCRAFLPGMVKRGYGRVVNVSSGGGSLTEDMPGPGAYGVTKAGLNALTRMLASYARGDVKINAMCPGWVRTDMGGPGAPRSVEEAADTVVWLATLPPSGPTNGFFRDRMPIPW